MSSTPDACCSKANSWPRAPLPRNTKRLPTCCSGSGSTPRKNCFRSPPNHHFYRNINMNKPANIVAAEVTKRIPTLSRFHALALFALTLATLLAIAGCEQGGGVGKPADVDYYTCMMHPSVKSQDSKAKCP